MTSKQSNSSIILLVISVMLLSLAAGFSLWRFYQLRSAISLNSLIVLPESRSIADFDLLDHKGKPFSLDDMKGEWSLIFFGFTSCPDICPNTLFQLQQARKLMLQQKPASALPRVYLISVDPERDTAEKLSEYLAYFDPSFIGLTGDEAQLQALARQLGIAFFVEPHESDNLEYNVDHSASMLLLNPMAELHGVLPAPHEASNIAQDVMTVIGHED